MTTKSFLAQQIHRYTTDLPHYLSATNFDEVVPTNSFKQELILTRTRLQPGRTTYQFDSSPYSFYISEYTPLQQNNNVNSTSLDALQPTILSTAHNNVEDTSFRIISAIPNQPTFTMLKNAFRPDNIDGTARLSKYERKQQYLKDMAIQDGLYIENDDELIINVDEEFANEYLDDDDDDDDDNNNSYTMNDGTTKKSKSNQNQSLNRNNNENVDLFADVLDSVFGPTTTTTTTHTNQPKPLGISNHDILFKGKIGDDGLMVDDYDTIAADVFNIDSNQTIDLFNPNSKTNIDPIQPSGPTKRKQPNILDTTQDLFDLDLAQSINVQDFDITSFLSGATVYNTKSNDELKQKQKEAKREQELNQILKDQGLMTVEEGQQFKRQRILGLTQPKPNQ